MEMGVIANQGKRNFMVMSFINGIRHPRDIAPGRVGRVKSRSISGLHGNESNSNAP